MHRLTRLTGHFPGASPLDARSRIQPCPSAGVATLRDDDVYILSAVRTPMGGFQGSLASLTAPVLGALVIKEAVKRAGISPAAVGEVFMGHVLQAGVGQAPARQACLGAGLPASVPCTTINKVCASGMKAVMMAANEIKLGHRDIVVAGGMESMSSAPYLLPKARAGMRSGDSVVLDAMMTDGLKDAYGKYPMGNCAEVCAATYKISRDEQDSHAEESYRRAAAANKAGLFKDEIVPVEIKNKGKAKTITVDDESTRSLEVMKIRQQKTVFKHALDAKIPSTVTGANASVISDGASALVLISGRTLKTLPEGVQKRVLGRVLSYADAALPPIEFTVAPAKAVPLALTKAGLQIKDINRFEINEAFSVVALANQRLLNIAPEDINVNGGAVALGHPLGSSGSRIIVTLLSTLKQAEQNLSAKGLKANLGVAAICNGGGGASAIVIERF